MVKLSFWTPRRFGLLVRNLPASQANRIEEVKGLPVEMAKDDKGQWKPAAIGFAKKNGIDPEKLEVRDFSGKEYLYAIKHLEGRPTKKSRSIDFGMDSWSASKICVGDLTVNALSAQSVG